MPRWFGERLGGAGIQRLTRVGSGPARKALDLPLKEKGVHHTFDDGFVFAGQPGQLLELLGEFEIFDVGGDGFLLRAIDEVAGHHAECVRQFFNEVRGGLGDSLFEPTDVNVTDAGPTRKFRLREVATAPQLTEACRKILSGSGVYFRFAHLPILQGLRPHVEHTRFEGCQICTFKIYCPA